MNTVKYAKSVKGMKTRSTYIIMYIYTYIVCLLHFIILYNVISNVHNMFKKLKQITILLIFEQHA